MATPIDRLLTKPIALVWRTPSGDEDEWGSPVLIEVITQTKCYVRQRRTTDASEEGTVLSEHWEVFCPPTPRSNPGMRSSWTGSDTR